MEISIVKSKKDQLRQGEILVIAKTEGDLCSVNLWQLYLSKAGIADNSTEYVFRLISSSKKQKKLVSSDRHISYSTYRESFKASFKGIVPDSLNTVPIPLDREERLFQPILELKKEFSNVMEDGKRRRLRICTLRIRCLQD